MIAFALALAISHPSAAPDVEDYLGRWDVLLESEGTFDSCWWKVDRAPDGKLKARMLVRWGSPFDARRVEVKDGNLILVQEERGKEVVFRSKLDGEKLVGTAEMIEGKAVRFEGRRAPELSRARVKNWGKPSVLFDGKSFEGWKRRNGKPPSPAKEGEAGWEVKDGVLSCVPGADNDLVSEEEFMDFKLHVEFRVEKGSNSGIYLRGRYEVQIADDAGRGPGEHGTGSIYGRVPPKLNASRQAGQWQSFDIVLVGRMVTVYLNDEPLIEDGYIDGITGGAYPDPWEGEPGPLMLQGDHGKVSFRNIAITVPARAAE